MSLIGQILGTMHRFSVDELPRLDQVGQGFTEFGGRVARIIAGLPQRPGLLLAIAAVLLGIALIHSAVRERVRAWRGQRWARDARTLTITPPVEVDAAGARQLWTHLTGLAHPWWRRVLYGQPHLVWEYTWIGRAAQISVSVPGVIPIGLVERAITAAWPGAAVTLARTPTSSLGATPQALTDVDVWESTGMLRLARPEPLPLGTVHDTDPLRALLEAGAGTREGETVTVRITARPVAGRRTRHLHHAARHPDQPPRRRTSATGTVLDGAVGLVLAGVRMVLDLLLPMSHQAGTGGVRRDPATARAHRAILDKASEPHWDTRLEFRLTAQGRGRNREQVVARLRGRAHAIASALAVYTGEHNALRRIRATGWPDRWRPARGDLLSVTELAALAHVPLDPTIAGLARAGARRVPAPIAVPTGGRDTKVLGDAQVGGHAVALPVTDARQHVHLIGATGSGKSTLLANLILSDAQAGRGVVVIDPKGDLVTDVLDRLPAHLADKIVLLDPDQPYPPRVNPLHGDDPDLVVDNVVGIFARIFHRHWGPRTDDVQRSACLTLLHKKKHHATLEGVPALLNSKQGRAPIVVTLDDPAGLGGFWSWYDSLSDGLRAQVIGPVLARLRAFLLRDFVRRVVGDPRRLNDRGPDPSIDAGPPLDMDKILNGGILLARLPKGTLGDDTVRLLGSFLVAQVWQAATARARIPEPQRRDATLYIDEAHNFLTLPRAYDDMLAEARGYHLSLVLAHQDLAQLPRELRDALSANARTKIFFNTSPEDAHILARHTHPELSSHDLANLGAHTAAARLIINNQETPAFTLTTRPPAPLTGAAQHIRDTHTRRAEYALHPTRSTQAESDSVSGSLPTTAAPGTREADTDTNACPPSTGEPDQRQQRTSGGSRPRRGTAS